MAARKAAVIGAGLAGLTAAWELVRKGWDVTVLEAQSRPGGRVLTLREPFSDGLYAEAGALMIPDTHDLTLRYVREFGLALDPFKPDARESLQFMDGKRVRLPAGQEWLPALAPGDHPFFTELGDPSADDWSVDSLKRYDSLSYGEFLDGGKLDPAAARLLKKFWGGLWGEGADTVSALAMLRDWWHLKDLRAEYRVRGGNDLLPKAFATRLGNRVRYGCRAVRIEPGRQSVKVVFVESGSHFSLQTDRLVCALPFSVLRNLEVAPPFTPEKQKAIRELPHFSATRVSVPVGRRFWREEGLDGFAVTDLPIGQIFNMTWNQPGERGILQCYAGGAEARRIAQMDDPERTEFVLGQMERPYPGINRQAEFSLATCWDLDPFARGASSWYRPGQMTELWPHVARPEGRVHFAGDQTSAWIRWMQGAIHSGLRAAREIGKAEAQSS